jgi:MFS family permease
MGASGRVALEHRDLRLYLGATFLSTIALQMQSAAVGYQVYERTGKAVDIGYVGLAQFLPMLLLATVSGDAADRFDRRRLLLVCHLVITGCAASLWLLAFGHGSLFPIYAVLVVFGIARAFSRPAGQALVTTLVPTHHFSNAVSWSSSTWQLASIAGPGIAGLLYWKYGSPGPVYLGSVGLEAATFVLVFALEIRHKPAGGTPSFERLLSGFRYVWANKLILGAISLDMFAVLLGGAVALLPIFAKDILKVGPWGYGILRSAPGLGASVMAIALAYRPLGRGTGKKLFIAVAVFGLFTVVFARSTSFFLSVFALLVLGAADMISVVTRQTIVQLATPPEMRGRVSAVNTVFIGASNELGEFESGLTAQWLGAVPAAVVGGIGTLGVIAIWAWLFPALRGVDRVDDLAPEP